MEDRDSVAPPPGFAEACAAIARAIGVFAAGDVRHRSPRGVASAVGDGALAARSIFEYLAGG